MANTWRERYGKLLADDPTNVGLMWHERTNLAADEINKSNEKFVYDFGSGECRLARLIEDKEYIAYDTENFSIYDDIEVITIDLVEEFPEIEHDNSVAVCLGFIDHIIGQDGFDIFMKGLSENFNKVIFSCQNRIKERVLKRVSEYFVNIELLGSTESFPGDQSVYVGKK